MAETGNKGVAEEGSPRSCEKEVAEMRTISGTEEWQGIKIPHSGTGPGPAWGSPPQVRGCVLLPAGSPSPSGPTQSPLFPLYVCSMMMVSGKLFLNP